MKTFRIGNRRFKCDDVLLGIPINPELPKNFSSTPNEQRPDRSRAWWGVPFIQMYQDDHPQFVAYWKGNTRYDVRRLDGGAWDRPTCHGMFGTQEEALRLARHLL